MASIGIGTVTATLHRRLRYPDPAGPHRAHAGRRPRRARALAGNGVRTVAAAVRKGRTGALLHGVEPAPPGVVLVRSNQDRLGCFDHAIEGADGDGDFAPLALS